MASVARRADTGEWEVRWKEREVSADGTARWVSRRRRAPTKATADRLRRLVEEQLALRGHYEPEGEIVSRTIGELVAAYLRAAAMGGSPESTVRTRASLLAPFVQLHGERPVGELTVGLLRDYAASLPGNGRQAATRHRKVLEVESAWSWGARASEEWPGLRWPQAITGQLGEVRPPSPVVALGAPSWADVDRMIAALDLAWHRQVALVLRYTGLRASQALRLTWADIDLEQRLVRVRAGVTGAKRGPTRVLPLHPALVRELVSWRPEGATGLLFPRRYQHRAGPHRGDVLVAPFRAAWEAAQVPRERWDVVDHEPDARAHGSPTHAIRRCVRSQLLRAEVPEAAVLYLVGQSQGVTGAAYVPEHSPAESPWWPVVVRAVEAIPPHTLSLALARRARA